MATENTSQSDAHGKKIRNLDFRVEIKITDKQEVHVFHAKPFDKDLSWLEFDLDSFNLDFILEDGDVRNFGTKVPDNLSKHMHNAHQVLMVQVDEKTGENLSGQYFPLIIHRD